MKPDLERLYARHIRPLPVEDQLSLLAAIARDRELTLKVDVPVDSLLELEGLGAEIWQGIYPQEYGTTLRAERGHRP